MDLNSGSFGILRILLPGSEVFRRVRLVLRMQNQPSANSFKCVFERGSRGLMLGRQRVKTILQ